jgi:hypothetical protein
MRHILLTWFVLLCVSSVFAQQDTSYIEGYESRITGRFYFSRKFTTLRLQNNNPAYALRYRPNTTLNMGVGATYQWATLNLAYGFGFLNPDRGQGKTRYLDLQFHGYGKKITIDFLGQFYKGFFLSPKGTAAPSNSSYYLRPDLRVNAVGATVQYVFNHKQFSYRASFLQNEWQKKSAGSFLIGVELYAGGIRADSSVVPRAINQEVTTSDIHRMQFIQFGPNAGYAYTYVFDRHFFVTGAGSLTIAAGSNTTYQNEKRTVTTGINPNFLLRVSTGYNSRYWSISFLYVSNSLNLVSNHFDRSPVLSTGNFRVNFVHRFRPSRKVKKYLKVIDNVDKKIEQR